MSERRVPPPKPAKPVTFRVEKDGASREVTIPAERAAEALVYAGLPVVTFDMLDNGGVMRILG